MKYEFIEARYTGEIKIEPKEIEKLDTLVYLGGSVQFLSSLNTIKKEIEKQNKKVQLIQGFHSFNEGQILGCDVPKLDFPGCVLIVSTGLFHGKAGLLSNNKTFVLNPITGKIVKLEVNHKKIKGLYLKFLMSKSIGIIISTKKGQYYTKRIEELEKKYPEKEFYKIITDIVNLESLVDFSYIDFFVNTACPRMMDDLDKIEIPILNIDIALDYEKIF